MKAALLATLAIVLCTIPTCGSAATPTISAGGGGHNVLAGSRDGIWSEPPDLEGLIASSEVIGQFGVETEIANDFLITRDTRISAAHWWGGYYNNNGCGDVGVARTWNLRFYEDGGCVPDTVLSEYINLFGNESVIYCQGGAYPIFQYEALVSFEAVANTLYWFSAQAADHAFPPQCGRLASANIIGCDSVFKSVYYSYADWTPCIDVLGVSFDASQEFVGNCSAGACCLPDGSCVCSYNFHCSDWLHGEFHDYEDCVDAACDPAEACCFVGGFCLMLTDWGCMDLLGDPQGSGTVCDPNPCAVIPVGCIDYGGYLHRAFTVGMPGSLSGVAASDTYAYGVVSDVGLLVIDANPHDPHIVGIADTPGDARAVAVSGAYAYVADGQSGLQVVDVEDPQNPVIVGSLHASADRVAVSGTHAYITGPDAGFGVVDIANPRHPVLVGSVPDLAGSLAVSGSYAFVANGESGLQVIDIRNASNPDVIGGVDTPGEASGVAISGVYAYVSDGYRGLQVVDFTNPASPEIVGSVDTSDYAIGVAVMGIRAYIADGSALVVVDITDPKNPRIAHSFETTYSHEVAVAANRAYFADYNLQVIDISSVESPHIVGGIGMPDYASNLFISDNLAYVADGASGVQIIDITDPYRLQIIGSVDTPGMAYDVALSGTHAYVADGVSGFQIVDIGDPRNPLLVGSVETPGRPYGVFQQDNYAYVTEANAGTYDGSFQVIDVVDPQSPQIVGTSNLPSIAFDVVVSGAHAYVAGGESGLHVIDISNPTDPIVVGNLDLSFHAWDVVVLGDRAYVAFDGIGLVVVNIEDPANPRVVGVVETPGSAVGVAIRGAYAYIADGGSGLQVIDITSPETFRIIGGIDTFLDCGQAEVMGSYVYVTDRRTLLVLSAQCDPAEITDHPDVISTVGLRAYPNPTSGQAVIRMHASTGGIVRATIHDIGGRLLRNLYEGVLRQDDPSLTWDGRDDAGRPVAPGMYLARVSTNEGTSTARILILR